MKKIIYEELLYLDKTLAPADGLNNIIIYWVGEATANTLMTNAAAKNITAYKQLVTDYTNILPELQKLMENNVTPNWYIGEYKWVKPGTIMPDGWVKVDIPDGYTLVQGSEEGVVNVTQPMRHTHVVNYILTAPGAGYAGTGGIPPTTKNGKQAIPSHDYELQVDEIKENDGGTYNLAKGIESELWRYEG